MNNLTLRATNGAQIIDITGEITQGNETALSGVFDRALYARPNAIVLNFSELEYMNSSGIGLLITLLIRAQRQNVALRAVGLSDHYKEIFELTRLDEAIEIFDAESAAVMEAVR